MSVAIIRQLTRREERAWARPIHMVETGCEGQVAYLPVPPGNRVETPTHDYSDVQWLAVVHDIGGLGPADFDQPTLEQFAARATHLALVCSAPDTSIYRVFAGTAAMLGRVLVVETTLPLYAAWGRFLSQYSPLTPLLECVPEGDRP